MKASVKKRFFDSSEQYEIKVFQIQKDFYELAKLGTSEAMVNYMVDKHRELVNDNDSIGLKIPKVEYDEVVYYSYVYNENLKDSYWKSFLPSSITDYHDFSVMRISFVLFAVIKGDIFATVGGGGLRVIKRYLNHRFGLDFFEYLTIPKEDVVVNMTVRGISGTLVQQSDIYRNGRRLIDCLSFTEIPTKINLNLREDLKNSIFDFIHFNNENVCLEVGSYFYIKHSIPFKTLHVLFKKINEVFRLHEPTSISSFVRVQDKTLVDDEFKKILLGNLYDDMLNMFAPNRSANPYKFDIDFIHPSKIRDFYECDKFELKAKGKRTPFLETSNKDILYKETLRYLYNNLENRNDQFEFGKILLGIRVIGYRDDKQKTVAMFHQHITCEIKYENRPVFQIDNNWYNVKSDFIDTINDRCVNLLDKNYLRDKFLNIPWSEDIKDEGSYNSKYTGIDNYYVFDKIKPQNIEFCDIMYENADTIYLVHVKDGFDAKIRDVSNQIIISANRFWNDINSGNLSYIKELVDSYNRKEDTPNINKEKFLSKFNVSKEIVYVMAFKSIRANLEIKERVVRSKSNIAKYSLIQCSHDMASRYPLKIFDLIDLQ
ncbi:DUF6119 family protein [uncultured Winogradskyella sp.]|uniref:DUF6119 family protein n=1 Tax=uncultured Winogradskyella sp. TaxID=395353 RepID=UPI00262AE6C5|nr:DUF6119 family protein [uncultured Winogradskyella sp.]